MVPLVMWFGVAGSVLSTAIAYGYLIIGNLHQIALKFRLKFNSSFQMAIRIVIGLFFMGITGWALSFVGLGSVDHGKIMCFLGMALSGILASLVFLAIELYLKVPQRLFKFKLNFRK